jgi:hypothetical protein
MPACPPVPDCPPRLHAPGSRSTMVAELMADEQTRKYARRKFLEVQHETQRGGKKARKLKAKELTTPKWARNRH